MVHPLVQSIVADVPMPVSDSDRMLPSPKEPMAVARVLIQERYSVAGQRLLRHWRGGYWQWRGSHWAELDNRGMRAAAYRFTEHASYLDTSKKEPEVKPWAPNRYKIADLLEAIAAICHLSELTQPPTWTGKSVGLPPAHELVSVTNGLLHISTRDIYDHDPRLFNQVAVPFDYIPSASSPDRWLEFLCDLWGDDPEAVDALQEFFGYAISGRTDLHKILLIVGPIRSGKGTIARILTHLIGKPNVTGPTLASLGTNFGLQDLITKPLAIISDARLGGANVNQVVERLLSISGEDTLTVDRKYRDPWTGQLPTRFVVISNELPRFGDASGAIATRFVMTTLQNSFLGRENHNLTSELLSELPGILVWALDGLERLRHRDRFTEPESSRDAIVALADLVSPVGAFVRERCIRGPHEVPVDDLYRAWRQWAEENGHRPGSSQVFGRDLHARMPELKVIRIRDGVTRGRRYRGIALKPSMDGTADH